MEKIGFNELPFQRPSENRGLWGIADRSDPRALPRKKKNRSRFPRVSVPYSCARLSRRLRLICSNWWRLIAYTRARGRVVSSTRSQPHAWRCNDGNYASLPEQKFESRAEPRARSRGCDSDIDGPAQIAPASASERLIENDAAIGSLIALSRSGRSRVARGLQPYVLYLR